MGNRGAVKSIRSDNGTNFIGAAKEIKEVFAAIDNDKISRFLLGKGCDWINLVKENKNVNWERNPPSASHMGGVWKRQIRTSRVILLNLVNDSPKALDDESLRTFFTEAKSIINCRPLTTEYLTDAQSLSPLTPNHLLTMKSKQYSIIELVKPSEFYR